MSLEYFFASIDKCGWVLYNQSNADVICTESTDCIIGISLQNESSSILENESRIEQERKIYYLVE